MRRAPSSGDDAKAPDVYVIGALNRSGTTFLADVLAATGHFRRSSWGFEDYLHAHARYLLGYVQGTLAEWRRNRPDLPPQRLAPIAEELAFALGAAMGVAQRAGDRAPTRYVLKTPEPTGLEHFFALHRHARLLLVIRDGRDTVESGRRSWASWSIGAAARAWATNVRAILTFQRGLDRAQQERCLLVRYESVALGDKRALGRVFRFARIPTRGLPWDKITSLPLRGSSTERGDRATLHWDPVPRPRDFNPIGRWHGWSKAEKRAFKRAAGKELIALGYASDDRW